MLRKIIDRIKKELRETNLFLEKHQVVRTTLFFSFLFLVFFAIYFSVSTISTKDDHFFHIRFAETIRENGLLESFQNFKSIYFSKHAQGGEYYIYYNFLFYFVMVPFSLITPLFLGLKLYAVFAAALGFSILYYVLKKFLIPKSFLWTILSLSFIGNPLIYRFFLSRPYTLAPALLILLLYFLHSKKYIGVFFVSFIYLFWHGYTFYFPFIIVFAYYVFEKFYGEKGDYKNVLWSTAGVVGSIGFVYLLAPNFLLGIYETVFGIFKETILGKAVIIPEGGELYPADFFGFAHDNPIFFSAFLISIFLYIYFYFAYKNKRNKLGSNIAHEELRQNILTGTLFFISVGFFAGDILVSRRFQDFFVFFGIIFVVVSICECLKYVSINNETAKKALKGGGKLLAVYLFISSMLFLQASLASGASPFTFKQVGEWINKNVPEGEVVYNVSWNWFPQLYYYAPKRNYVIGLEPRFLYEYNHELYWKWSHISSDGFVCLEEKCEEKEKDKKEALKNDETKKKWFKEEGDNIANVLMTDFKTHYVVISKEFPSLKDLMDNNSHFKQVLNDKDTLFIYKIE